jgi:RNA polymerase sigma-70 factor, ECF subfamily
VDETESALIDACLAGDERAWRRLVEHFQQPVGRQMWRFSRDRAVWEDLVQDVFVELYRSLPSFRRTGTPLEHWLRRIATRVGYRYWKQEARQRGRHPLPPVQSVPATQGDAMEASEAADQLHRLLSQLSPKDRMVLTLTYFDECDTKEISRRTGWNRAAVKMRLMRARRKLRTLVESSRQDIAAWSINHGHPTVD